MKILTISLVGLIFLSLSACSTTGPVIYPNSHFLSVGKQVAEQDIEACRELAESSGAKEGAGQLGNVATGTAMGAGVGAASGAVGGAIYGAAGQGSLIGAASGATAGFLRSLLFSSRSSKHQFRIHQLCIALLTGKGI
jgi:hypothetical protein